MNTHNLRWRFQRAVGTLQYIWKAEVIYKDLLKTIDGASFEAVKRSCQNMDLGRPGEKYLKSSMYIRENIVRALALKLDQSKKCNVLDLGSGPGYFLLVCRHLGHDVLGLDLSGNPVYDKLVAFFQIPRIDFRIQPFQNLPAFQEPFDLVTAFSINFDRYGAKGRSWSVQEWEFFLSDVHTRLTPSGQVLLRLNRSLWQTPKLADMLSHFSGFGAKVIDDRSVLLCAL